MGATCRLQHCVAVPSHAQTTHEQRLLMLLTTNQPCLKRKKAQHSAWLYGQSTRDLAFNFGCICGRGMGEHGKCNGPRIALMMTLNPTIKKNPPTSCLWQAP